MPAHDLGAAPGAVARPGRAMWTLSWPLLMGVFAYSYFLLYHGQALLRDGDTYWHVAAGQWILKNGAVPTTDPFSHSMPATAWTAHEWLSEVILASVYKAGGWTALVAATALAFSATISVMTRALLKWLEPIYALLFAGLAMSMTASHVLARPHVLAMPLMMIWTIELVRASEQNRSPRLWFLPVMTLWANLHGGFTLGIAIAFAFAAEALIAAHRNGQLVATVKPWSLFLVLAIGSALVTPQGIGSIAYTWAIFFDHSFALERIGEWQSPSFQVLQPFELWLLGGLALVLHQGLRLPPIRLVLLVGLLHLALKHARSIELVGLLVPLFVAAPFAEQWLKKSRGSEPNGIDRFFHKLAWPAGPAAVLGGVLLLAFGTLWISRARPIDPPEALAPASALQAVRKANIEGPVLNSYSSGGYLIFSGVPVFIDGRADIYGEAFLKQYLEAINLSSSDGLEKLVSKYKITWTLLDPQTPAVALLDHHPDWRRVYADDTAVVHAKTLR